MKTEIIKIHPEFPESEIILYCAKKIRDGALVIFPTETVYGIAADSLNPKAIQRLKEIKKRSEEKPFSILIPHAELISNYTSLEEPALYKLINNFWPGPLTIVVPDKSDSEKTTGLRIPNNITALKLIRETARPIAAPSANFEGSLAPSTCSDALKELDGLVEIALDAGKTGNGISSTVVNAAEKKYEILREGSVTKEDIEKVINKKVIIFVCTGNSCRSVMAEYYLKKLLKDKKNVEVISAGTGVYLHSSASSETISLLREEGVDASSHIAKPLNNILLKQSDLIFVMTQEHRRQVLERAPGIEKRVYLLREFSGERAVNSYSLDIPDPIGRSYDEYKECFSIIKNAVEKIVNLL